MRDSLAATVGDELAEELTKALGCIRHCLDQLNDDQVWWRPSEAMNSIGNLLLHLTGNVRQWVVSGLGAAADARNRPAEFAERERIPKAELLAQVEATVAEAKAVLL